MTFRGFCWYLINVESGMLCADVHLNGTHGRAGRAQLGRMPSPPCHLRLHIEAASHQALHQHDANRIKHCNGNDNVYLKRMQSKKSLKNYNFHELSLVVVITGCGILR